MGIRGLSGYIRWRLPGIRRSLRLTDHMGERWGIDCSCLLYRARAANLSIVTVMASLIARLRRASIEPIVVFDGRAPSSKANTLDQRRVQREAAHRELLEISSELTGSDLTDAERVAHEKRSSFLHSRTPQISSSDRDEVKQLLYSAGVLFVTAAGEADDVLSYMAHEGKIQAVISTDMDMLARGIPLLVLPETSDAVTLTTIDLARLLAGLKITYNQFVYACVLMGTDYAAKGVRTVEPRLAFDMATCNHHVSDSIKGEIQMLTGDGADLTSLLPDSQRKKLADGAPMPEPENLIRMAATYGWPNDWYSTLAHH